MISHPLDLKSKLSHLPRSLDWVFFVNITLIAMAYLFFCSRFVLSPALVIRDTSFTPLEQGVERVSYVPGTVVISITAGGQIFTDTGLVSRSQLRAWLVEKIKNSPDASLLLRADAGVALDDISSLYALAKSAGFTDVAIPVVPGKAAPPP